MSAETPIEELIGREPITKLPWLLKLLILIGVFAVAVVGLAVLVGYIVFGAHLFATSLYPLEPLRAISGVGFIALGVVCLVGVWSCSR